MTWLATLLVLSATQSGQVPYDEDLVPLRLTIDGSIRHGETVRVTVEPKTDVRLTEVILLLSTLDTVKIDSIPPFVFEVTIPATRTGQMTFSAIGKRDNGNVCCSSEIVHRDIESALQFKKVHVLKESGWLTRVGDKGSVGGWAYVTDDEVVPLTPGNDRRNNWLTTMPIEFSSRDPQIVAVNEYGDLLATGAGETVIEIRLQGLEAELPVKVRTANKQPVADVGSEHRCLPAGSWLVVEGTATDPDNGPHPLTFGWSWNGRLYDFEFEGAETARLSGVVPDIDKFTLSFRAKDGAESGKDYVTIHVDRNLDGLCTIGYQKSLEVEPFVSEPE